MKNYWVTPDGKLIEVGCFGHNEFAVEFLGEDKAYSETHKDPYEHLHDLGWVRIKAFSECPVSIIGNCIDLTKPMRNTMCPAMNTTQMRVVKRLCEDEGIDFHKAINDRRFW